MAHPTYIRSPLCLAKRLRVGPVRDAVIPVVNRRLHLPSAQPAATFSTAAFNKQADVSDHRGVYVALFLAVSRPWSTFG